MYGRVYRTPGVPPTGTKAIPTGRMSISFPNASRSYDHTRRAVRFWGHDSAIETSFFVTAEALRHLSPGTASAEPALLAAFDSNRDAIRSAASKVYRRGLRGSYELGAGDF